MCNAHVVVTVSAAANAFAATLDRFSCRDGCGSRSAASLSLRSGCFVRTNFVPRKRDYELPTKWQWKILRTRNGGVSIITEVSGDENNLSSEGDGRDPLLHSTSATDTRRLAHRTS